MSRMGIIIRLKFSREKSALQYICEYSDRALYIAMTTLLEYISLHFCILLLLLRLLIT